MESLKGIDLQDSFILGWEVDESEVKFILEASIWPESQLYQKPQVNEYTCYRNCILKISDFSKCSGLQKQSEVNPTIDIDGSADYGNIDSFVKTANGFILVC
ncbi:hypothetical protein SOPP22_10785, partial [Shewanella sp. OPT22]